MVSLSIVGAYLVVGCLWIVGSDYVVSLFYPGADAALSFGTVKGIGFIVVTSILLTFLLFRHETAHAADRAELNRLLGALEEEVSARTDALRKLAEERAADSDSRYRALFENHHTVMLLIDPEACTIIDANPAASEFYGFPLEQLRGAPLAQIDSTPPEQLRRAFSHAILREHEGFRFRHRLADGSTREVEMFTGQTRHQGRDLAFAIIHDITARVRADELLHLRTTALDASASEVLITDAAGRIVWANRAFETNTGYTLPEAIGKTPGSLLKSGYHDTAFYRRMWDTITGGDTWSGELVNRKKDGSLYTESAVITPLREDTGPITHFIGVKQDITEKKEMESRFLRAQRLESIGKLAGGIAHDINNILAPILLSVGLLKTERLDPRISSVLDTIESSAARGADLVRQILSFARGVEGKRITLNLRYLAKDIEKIVRETFPKNITLELDLPADLPLIQADPTQLHQVLMNLTVNARDAMPNGGTLSLCLGRADIDDVFAEMTPGARPGHYLTVTVRDTGVGMPKAVLDHIFEPFFTTKEQGQGTGLGLATTHTIVKNHGGFITVESALGRGTAFHVYLPIAPVPADGPLDTAPTPPNPSRVRNEGILVVDDEPTILDLARIALRRFGYRVLTATNGAEAVETYTRQRDEIDLVLMDIAMPVMDGHAAILALRTINPEVLIVASSGHTSALSSEVPAAAFIPKPYTAQTLVNTLDRVLESALGVNPANGHPSDLQTGHFNRHNSTKPDSSALARSAPPDSAAQ